MKVIIISPNISVKGGISTVIKNYINAGFLNEYKVSFLSTHKDVSKIQKAKIAFISIIKFLFIANSFDLIVIHSGDIKSVIRKIPFIIISKFFRKKIVFHFHGALFMNEYNNINLSLRKIISKSLSFTNLIICLSDSWKSYVESIIPQCKAAVLKNSIILPPAEKKIIDTANKINISFLGLIGNRKGIFDFLFVAKDLKDNKIEFTLNIAGNGDISKLNQLTKDLALNNECKYLGWISDIERHDLLNMTDIYILPSYGEGMPMSVIEAMSYGIPIVSTNVGGIPELIENGKSGLLLMPGDKKGLYDAIYTLCMDTKLRSEMGINARKKIQEDHNLKTNIKELYKLYESALNG